MTRWLACRATLPETSVSSTLELYILWRSGVKFYVKLGCLAVLGGCGQDNVVGLSRTQFLADVGFKLKECEVRLRRKISSAAESRRPVVVTARPEDDPGAALEPPKRSS
jgi:hypothetical protein